MAAAGFPADELTYARKGQDVCDWFILLNKSPLIGDNFNCYQFALLVGQNALLNADPADIVRIRIAVSMWPSL